MYIWGAPADLKSEKKYAKLRKLHFSSSFQFKYSEILTLFPAWRTFETFPEVEILRNVVECTLELNKQLLKISKIFASDLNSTGLPHFEASQRIFSLRKNSQNWENCVFKFSFHFIKRENSHIVLSMAHFWGTFGI